MKIWQRLLGSISSRVGNLLSSSRGASALSIAGPGAVYQLFASQSTTQGPFTIGGSTYTQPGPTGSYWNPLWKRSDATGLPEWVMWFKYGANNFALGGGSVDTASGTLLLLATNSATIDVYRPNGTLQATYPGVSGQLRVIAISSTGEVLWSRTAPSGTIDMFVARGGLLAFGASRTGAVVYDGTTRRAATTYATPWVFWVNVATGAYVDGVFSTTNATNNLSWLSGDMDATGRIVVTYVMVSGGTVYSQWGATQIVGSNSRNTMAFAVLQSGVTPIVRRLDVLQTNTRTVAVAATTLGVNMVFANRGSTTFSTMDFGNGVTVSNSVANQAGCAQFDWAGLAQRAYLLDKTVVSATATTTVGSAYAWGSSTTVFVLTAPAAFTVGSVSVVGDSTSKCLVAVSMSNGAVLWAAEAHNALYLYLIGIDADGVIYPSVNGPSVGETLTFRNPQQTFTAPFSYQPWFATIPVYGPEAGQWGKTI